MGIDLITGSLRKSAGQGHNSVIHFPKGGAKERVYDKRVLLPFGEYLPGGSWTEQWRGKIKGLGNLTPGNDAQSFEAFGFVWSPNICYEAILPDITREGLNHKHADVLLNLTNDVWFGDTAAAEQHLTLQILRAIENRVWLVRAANSGISAFVDPSGTIRAKTDSGIATTMTAEIPIPALHTSVYRRYGDLWLWVLALLTLATLIYKNRALLRNNLATSSVETDRPDGGLSN